MNIKSKPNLCPDCKRNCKDKRGRTWCAGFIHGNLLKRLGAREFIVEEICCIVVFGFPIMAGIFGGIFYFSGIMLFGQIAFGIFILWAILWIIGIVGMFNAL